MTITIKALEKKDRRNDFSCGHALLDDYLKKQARQDINRDLSTCFVLADTSLIVIGYYTLSAYSIPLADLPDVQRLKLPPSNTNLLVVLMGRLAVDSKFAGNGYGALLLLDALNRSFQASKNLGALAVVVDPIDEKAISFYKKYGFTLLPSSGKMMLPMKTIAALVDLTA